MENTIIICVLLVILMFAVLRMKKHFKGGGCCGNSNTIRTNKTLRQPVLGKKIATIDGMHCENCEIRVENALNRLDGITCKVNRKKKTAVIFYCIEVQDALLKETVEKLGYSVVQITDQ